MFSFKYAIICILAGLLAGYCFDKKKSNMVWVGIFIYPIVFSSFYVNFPYDSSWAFIALVEVLAGHGLYKMGLDKLFEQAFPSFSFPSELKSKSNRIKVALRDAKAIYNSKKITSYNYDDKTLKKLCKQLLRSKGYELFEQVHYNYIVMRKDNLSEVLFHSGNISEVLDWAKKAKDLS